MGRKVVNMAGRPFGHWTVVSRAEDKINFAGTRRYVAWKCRCRCGEVRTLTSKALLSGGTKSCGCAQAELKRAAANAKHPDASMRHLISIYKSASAKHRGLVWALTYFQATLLFQSNCHYCGDVPGRVHVSGAGTPTRFNGIDRVDSSKGYEFDNCVPCCTTCNTMKMAMSKEAFLKQCARIVLRHNVLTEGATC